MKNLVGWVSDVGLRQMDYTLGTSMVNSWKTTSSILDSLWPICMSKLAKRLESGCIIHLSDRSFILWVVQTLGTFIDVDHVLLLLEPSLFYYPKKHRHEPDTQTRHPQKIRSGKLYGPLNKIVIVGVLQNS